MSNENTENPSSDLIPPPGLVVVLLGAAIVLLLGADVVILTGGIALGAFLWGAGVGLLLWSIVVMTRFDD